MHTTTTTTSRIPQPIKLKAVRKLTLKLNQLNIAAFTQTNMGGGGSPVEKAYTLKNYRKRESNTTGLEPSTPLTYLLKIGTTGTRYGLEPYLNKPRLCSNCQHWGHLPSKYTHKTKSKQCGGEHKGKSNRQTPKYTNCSDRRLPQSPDCTATINKKNIIEFMNSKLINHRQPKMKLT
jgi:hypothetical protein